MINKDFISEDLGDVVIETINFSRATLKEAEEMKNRIRSLADIGCKKIIVDLSLCDFCDSSFMGVLVLCSKKTLPEDFDFGIVIRPGSYIQKIIESTGLNKVLNIYNDRSIAINKIKLIPKDLIKRIDIIKN